MLPHSSGKERVRVTNMSQENCGNTMGHAKPNPILDSQQYVVEFEDGNEAELTANAIYQRMYAQCDPDGNQYLMLDSIRVTLSIHSLINSVSR